MSERTPITVETGKPFNFELRKSSHNGKVLEAIGDLSENLNSATGRKKFAALFEPINLAIEPSALIKPRLAKPKSVADQLGPAYDFPDLLSRENQDNLLATEYSMWDALRNNPDLSPGTIDKVNQVFGSYDAHVAKTLNGEVQEVVTKPKLSTNRKLALAGLTALLAACSGLPALSEVVPVEAQRTVQPTDLPTATKTSTPTPTESPTPTETIQVEPRVPRLTLEELYPDQFAKEYLEIDGGGYFSGQPELEKPEQYIYMDYSNEGQLRIVEATALDENSWGFFFEREKNIEGSGVIPMRAFSNYIAWELISRGKEVRIVWGDFTQGTIFFMSDELAFQYTTPRISVEEVKKVALPIEDDRFSCTEVDSYYESEGKLRQKPGTICEYTG